MPGDSHVPTRYAIICPEHGQVFLTKEEYDRQMGFADAVWFCPICGQHSDFDDDNYDNPAAYFAENGPPDTSEQKMWEPDPDDLLPPYHPDEDPEFIKQLRRETRQEQRFFERMETDDIIDDLLLPPEDFRQ